MFRECQFVIFLHSQFGPEADVNGTHNERRTLVIDMAVRAARYFIA